MDITEKEQRLIEELRKLNYGQVTIFMQENQPARIEQIKESVKL